MPAKGQTCASCAGACCKGITFKLPSPQTEADEAIQDQALAGTMGMTMTELKMLGVVEIEPDDQTDCTCHLNGGCSVQDSKPRLCRSYYCHGKHWEPKD